MITLQFLTKLFVKCRPTIIRLLSSQQKLETFGHLDKICQIIGQQSQHLGFPYTWILHKPNKMSPLYHRLIFEFAETVFWLSIARSTRNWSYLHLLNDNYHFMNHLFLHKGLQIAWVFESLHHTTLFLSTTILHLPSNSFLNCSFAIDTWKSSFLRLLRTFF